MSGEIHTLSGAYATDALDDIERAEFERHLSGCASCRAEVDGLREAASQMAETAAVAPPAALRGRVLAMSGAVRPLPPVLAAAEDRARSTRRRFPLLVAAAAVLIGLGGAGATAWHPWSDDDSTSVTTLADASDAHSFTGVVQGGGQVTVVRSRRLNQAVVTATGLPRLPDDRTYQLWLMHDGVPASAGIMQGDAANVLLQGDARTADAAAISVEPSGGSARPTTTPIAVVTLA